METITFPSLETTVWKKTGNKNSVKQLLSEEIKFKTDLKESGRSFIIIGNNEKSICITCNKNNYSDNTDYVILSDKKPSVEKILSKEIKLKKWIKHPKLEENTAQNVIDSWENNFNFIEEDVEKEIKGLRTPQTGAIYSILGHLKVSDKTGTVVLPTGTGKTETMLSVLIANRCKKLLVIVPSDALREQIFNKFFTLGLLKSFGIVDQSALYPKVGIMKQQFSNNEDLKAFFDSANVVVATMNVVGYASDDQQEEIASVCSHLFIDEAHHVKAKVWDTFKSKFPKNKVLQFTATPFRNDGKRLEGQTIFNFPLRKAQEQGYFKKINFITVKKYSQEEADKAIANKAVQKLKEDLKNGFNHILMARCSTKTRAKTVFDYYKDYSDLNPVMIFSGVENKKGLLNDIVNKKHSIIVAVDMLGEGFDLPELKIAAFHDIRKSLPVTLQFAGRFTRTKHDEELGEASFIANADIDFENELSELYAQDSDWNLLLSSMSSERIDDKIDFENLISGFSKLDEPSIPFQNIRPALSTVVYKNHTDKWQPENFINGIPNYDNFEYKFYDINHEKKIMVIINANKTKIEWGNFKDIYEREWHIIIVFWETKNNLLFIHSSDKSGLFKELAASIIGEKAELINQTNVFKAFYGINRVILQNVGLKEFLGRHIRFRMSAGSDVESALTKAEKEKGQKAFVVGTGYENGEKITLGCSYKGRIWSKMKGDLIQFQDWCEKLSNKLADDTIDPNQVLKETLIPELVDVRPKIFPVWIDWHEDMYNFPETKYQIMIGHNQYDLSSCELKISNPSENGELFFDLKTENEVITFEKKLFKNDNDEPDFIVTQKTAGVTSVQFGAKNISLANFFNEYIPVIWFADGASLQGNQFVRLKQTVGMFKKSELISLNWDGVDLSKEAQGVNPKITNSIQYKMISELKKDCFDIIYDDDGAGEIADIVAIKEEENKLKINLYHLKYAKEGKVNNQIANFYEVCGQAQKSIHWKHKSGDEFIKHLLKRQNKRKNDQECSRIEKGTIENLEKLLRIAKKKIPIEFEVYIVQPSLSKEKVSDNILTLLGMTENFLLEFAAIKLKVLVSE